MFNRVSGLSILVVAAGSIAYQLVKQHRENVEAERRARIEGEQIINQLKEFNARISVGPSMFDDILTDFREGRVGNAEEAPAGQNI